MSLFRDIDDILNSAKVEFEELKTQLESEKAATPAGPFFDYDIEKYGSGNKLENTFFWGDNLEFMKLLLAGGLSGKVQLVYIDPPFFSKAKYEAYVGYKGHIVRRIRILFREELRSTSRCLRLDYTLFMNFLRIRALCGYIWIGMRRII